MSSKIEIVKAFIQYGVLSPDSIKSKSRKYLETLVSQGMKKLNVNLLLMNIPEYGDTDNVGRSNITPEVMYDTLKKFGSPLEVLHHCKYVYVALVEDPESIVEQLSGNKIGKNTIKVVAYPTPTGQYHPLPHNCLDIYFPKKKNPFEIYGSDVVNDKRFEITYDADKRERFFFWFFWISSVLMLLAILLTMLSGKVRCLWQF